MSALSREIAEIRCEMVRCQLHCKGIINNPRCLFLDPSDAKSVDCVIVGKNPGPIKSLEREPTDGTACLNKHIKAPYYKKLKVLANELGFKSILWTELCKCQKDKDQGGEVPLQTFRTCIHQYLEREIEAVGADVPLIAVGNKAYRALCYRYTNRRVIGVPHATGAHGHLSNLMKNYIEKAKDAVNSAEDHECVRIFPKDFKKQD